MSQTLKWSMWRFSLRASFVLITAICCVLAYAAGWKHQRQKFLAKHCALYATSQAVSFKQYQQYEATQIPVNFTRQQSGAVRMCRILPLVAEGLHRHVTVWVPESDVNRFQHLMSNDYAIIPETQREYRLARRLFPEAIIGCYVKSNDKVFAGIVEDATWRSLFQQ